MKNKIQMHDLSDSVDLWFKNLGKQMKKNDRKKAKHMMEENDLKQLLM